MIYGLTKTQDLLYFQAENKSVTPSLSEVRSVAPPSSLVKKVVNALDINSLVSDGRKLSFFLEHSRVGTGKESNLLQYTAAILFGLKLNSFQILSVNEMTVFCASTK